MEELKVYVDESFLNIFDRLIENEELDENKLNLFSIKIKDKEFNYSLLISELTDYLINFCTSPKDYIMFYNTHKLGSLSKEAREKFKEYSRLRREGANYQDKHTKDGELGELILYSLLESHLQAPKILTKMRFKTSNNDAIKRSDGIHLLKCDDGYYKLIYGESKLYENIDGGIKKAFESIQEFKSRNDNNIDTEYNFLISNLDSEFTEREYEYVKNILVPNETDIEYDTAFAIFIGFEVEIPEVISNKSPREYKTELKMHLECMIRGKVDLIKNEIINSNLINHELFIYFMPFVELNDSKVKILEGILR